MLRVHKLLHSTRNLCRSGSRVQMLSKSKNVFSPGLIKTSSEHLYRLKIYFPESYKHTVEPCDTGTLQCCLRRTMALVCFLHTLELIKHRANEQEVMRGCIKARRKSPYLHFALGGLGSRAGAPSGLRRLALCWLLKQTHTHRVRLHG